MNPPTDCLRCGACCFSPSDQFVRVTGEDWTRLGEAAGRVAHFVGNRAFMRMSEGHCAALEIRRAGDGGAEYFCTLYDRRPQICRDLARGSAECEGEIAVKSVRSVVCQPDATSLEHRNSDVTAVRVVIA